jgi:alpha,alpha-trehalase
MTSTTTPAVLPEEIRAVIFDMDGVITDTASVHAEAWKRLFDEYLRARADRTAEPFVPFDADEDYRRYVDGKGRFDGVRSFLASRGIQLPEGNPNTLRIGEPSAGWGIGRTRCSRASPARRTAYPSTVAWSASCEPRGIGTAAISASRNAAEVLDAAGLGDLFAVTVDAPTSMSSACPANRISDVRQAARRLVDPVGGGGRGYARGRGGGTRGWDRVRGRGRSHRPRTPCGAGADVVVSDLAELGSSSRRTFGPPVGARTRGGSERCSRAGAWPCPRLRRDAHADRQRPEDALLPAETRAAIGGWPPLAPVAIVSGRDLADVRRLIGIEGIAYAGSHGFDVVLPDGSAHQRGTEFLPALEAAERDLRARLASVPGAQIEAKRFAIAVHVRRVRKELVPDVEAAVDGVAAADPGLRRTGGKKVFEIRPAVAWDKGKALLWLLDVLELGSDTSFPSTSVTTRPTRTRSVPYAIEDSASSCAARATTGRPSPATPCATRWRRARSWSC